MYRSNYRVAPATCQVSCSANNSPHAFLTFVGPLAAYTWKMILHSRVHVSNIKKTYISMYFSGTKFN